MRKDEGGFTLFEIMITLAIVGLMMGLVVVGMTRSVDRNMKKTANRLSSTIRYLYNKSAMEGLYIRLVFDIDERSYWVEATADPFVLSKEAGKGAAAKKKKDEKKKEGEAKDAAKEGEEKGEAAKGGEEAGPQKLKVPEPKFGQVDSYLLKPTKLPDSIFIKDIQVEHKSGPAEGGQESIYFFPNGYVERAIINLRDEKDEMNYSLATNPISGHVSIEDRYRRMGEE